MKKTNSDKHCFMGGTTLPELAASLDSIYKKVDSDGLGENTMHELKNEIEAVSDRFGISPKAAVLLAAILASFFFQISGLQLAISAGFVLFSSVCILFQTSAIIHGGERNYIMATISLYVSIYNLFVSLLQIFGIMGGDD